MIQNLKQYIHCALLLSAIVSSNRKIQASIAIETNKSNLAQGGHMKRESKTTI
jgi:hypothetical protein